MTLIGDSAFGDSLNNIYYTGTKEDWGKIEIMEYNIFLRNATIYYYSESEPTTDGNYWHYVDGVPTAWIKQD